MNWLDLARADPGQPSGNEEIARRAWGVFTTDFRSDVRERVIAMAHEDPRVVAAAVVGSEASGTGDRWSDLDLTFGVKGVEPLALLNDWAGLLRSEFGAAVLFDLPAAPFLYRVFLLPGALQVDLSAAPADQFGRRGGACNLLFGEAVEEEEWQGEPRSAEEMFGYAVHHAVRAKIAMERHRWVQSAYWLNDLREEVLALAYRRLNLNGWQAQDAYKFSPEVTEAIEQTLAASFHPAELERALRAGIAALLEEGERATALASEVRDDLLLLAK
jgi:hypothetical protein